MAVVRSLRFRLSRPGTCLTQRDGKAFGDAGGELEDALFPAAEGDLPVMEGAERGVPVDPGHQGGAVPDAGAGVQEAGEVVAVQDAAVADEQLGACSSPGTGGRRGRAARR